MAYDDFLSLLGEARLINDIFTERDAILAYAQSMMTQVDELDSDRHMKMQPIEFYETIARAADVLSLAPADSNVSSTTNHTSLRIGH